MPTLTKPRSRKGDPALVAPHSTPQCVEVRWWLAPKQYKAECNRKKCKWPGGRLRYNFGDAQQDARNHEIEDHS